MKKAKIAMVSLGHYIYFAQFEGLREELMQKSEEFKAYLDPLSCDVTDVGYIDCVEDAYRTHFRHNVKRISILSGYDRIYRQC